MEASHLALSSLLFVLVAFTSAEPEPAAWRERGYTSPRRGYSGYNGGASYGRSPRRETGYNVHTYKRKTIKCYQCAYSPGKTTYKEVHEPVPVSDPYNPYARKVEYRVRKVPVRRRGGWDKCLGPFNDYQARAFGVDIWECHDNCYTRIDAYGNLFRGCYKGEYDVNPNLIGCHKQAGDVYCFCEGDKCNNAGVQGIGRGGRRYK